jgi:hypothetical protein
VRRRLVRRESPLHYPCQAANAKCLVTDKNCELGGTRS